MNENELIVGTLTEVMNFVTDVLKEQNKELESINGKSYYEISEDYIEYVKKYAQIIAKGDLCIDILNYIMIRLKPYL